KLLEVPAAMIGLVWNSMMSMAGGWFFLTVNEAFTLGNKDFRLPGIGSYMNEAINRGDTPAMLAAIVAMVVMIVTVDQVFWRPIVVWCQKYKLEEQADADKPQSWVLNLLARSRLYKWAATRLARRRPGGAGVVAGDGKAASAVAAAKPAAPPRVEGAGDPWAVVRTGARWLVLAAVLLATAWGTWKPLRLLVGLP